jgi:hypothetical protein
MTCDNWQSNSLNSYLGITCHYIAKGFETKNKTLALKFLEDSKTAAYLTDMINSCLIEWGIKNKASQILKLENLINNQKMKF